MNSKRKHTDLQLTNDSAFLCVDSSVITSIPPVDFVLGTKEAKQKVTQKHACEYTNCDKTYRDACALHNHLNYMHLNIYNNVCDRIENGTKCEYKSESVSAMKLHKEGKHDKIKKHKCSDCEKLFENKSIRKRHWNAWHSPPDHPCRTKFK